MAPNRVLTRCEDGPWALGNLDNSQAFGLEVCEIGGFMGQTKVANELGLGALIDRAIKFAARHEQVQLGQVLTRQKIDVV